jgi:hypothetical protein
MKTKVRVLSLCFEIKEWGFGLSERKKKIEEERIRTEGGRERRARSEQREDWVEEDRRRRWKDRRRWN